MCGACAMAAAAGPSGVRSWLHAHHLTWLTPRRMRAATIALVVVALGILSIGLRLDVARALRSTTALRSRPLRLAIC